jgi:hypothetical protein
MKTALLVAAFDIKDEPRHPKYITCLKTWESWCKNNNIDFIPLTGRKENIVDVVFSKWTDLDKFIDLNNYDYITMVDFDTVVRWDCPNFMEQFYHEGITVTMVLDQGGPYVGKWHYDQWLSFDPNLYSYSSNYFNSGFISAKSEVFKLLIKEMPKFKEYYLSHKDKQYHPVGIGIDKGIRLDAPDQTPVNLILNKHYKVSISPNILNYMVSHYVSDLNNDISYINDALIIHYGSGNVLGTQVVDNFWENFKSYYPL